MRPRKVRRVLALAAFGAILAGTGLGYGIGEALTVDRPSVGDAAGITIEVRR